ncbi:hypothetical protein Tcan_07672 [Toxocara canis]|uniref:Uncharacterized protein n=1 Tax=Toxocara canis TaxID=6265 RepID=A0A0B2VQM3_TOXCA|nr:hypothetical protein Tcan_07672 [Toxocara canis]
MRCRGPADCNAHDRVAFPPTHLTTMTRALPSHFYTSMRHYGRTPRNSNAAAASLLAMKVRSYVLRCKKSCR